ncbi:MAG: SRPBCC domain-containing protein [Candidatus Dormibacteraeota bacterium]|nr:SRPBCC domain-containing protein [Candidatus Dormibacteraeota bacterium]
MAGITATADIDIEAPAGRVWRALTDPDEISRYFFNTKVETDWKPGSRIVWKGEWEGKAYEDKGEVLEVEPERLLSMTHYSPMTGQPDVPESYHTLRFTLSGDGDTTHVELTQDNNADDAEAERSATNWRTMLDGLKRTVEAGS